jgi:adenosylcobinamide-GDP ribazoletransferase
MLKKEVQIFFAALMFFTRLPCPKWVKYSDEYQAACSRYFSLVGVIIGSIGGAVFYGCSLVFPFSLAVLLSMISTILVTGAFHEDGLADACDGFGGGWTKENILVIMKDSRLGTFGTVGLVSILSLKYCCLIQMAPGMIVLSLISAHALSRFAASTLLYTLPYVRNGAEAKSKPAMQRISVNSLIFGSIWGILPLVLFKNVFVFIILFPVAAVTLILSRYFLKWIGGQTGDCGGATQQICEVTIYLSFLVLWKFI